MTGFVWEQLTRDSGKGLRRLLERARGYQYLGHHCAAPPEHEGRNTLWRQCRVRVVRAAGDTTDMHLFGVIVERGGQYKFASYDTEF